MARNRRARENESDDGSDYCGDAERFDGATQYLPPGHGINLGRTWLVRLPSEIVDDIKSCGYSINKLVDAICRHYQTGNKLGLLGSLLESLKSDSEQYSEYLSYQAIAEEAEGLLIEGTLRKNAMGGEDTQALKFYLERRLPDKFGRVVNKGGNAGDEELQKILEALPDKRKANE